MPSQKGVRYAAPLLPPEDGLPNWRTTINVTMIPAGPSSRRRTAAMSATTKMMSEMIGHAIQNEADWEPFEPVGDDHVDDEARREREPREPESTPAAGRRTHRGGEQSSGHVAADEERGEQRRNDEREGSFGASGVGS